MSEINLTVQKRKISTKGAVNKLRREKYVPGVFYSKGQDSVNFAVHENALRNLVYTKETHIVNFLVDGNEPAKAILKDIQFDPVTDKIVHIDLLGVTVGQELQIQVPVSFVGSPIGVKEGGVLQQYLHKLEVACLPKDIPEHFEINISKLKLGESIHVSDLNYENIRILNASDVPLVAVTTSRVETTEDVLEVAPAEPELISKGKSEEE
ncbi:MAG: 50S ribosomal protein L25 [Bacteroidetes bacterium]|nr:50S ribosomal protein L25 [Bacteroidota bacterium]MBU1678920.1 50S ribosomal protein L25 [Bacteroidota bacterium]MBU2506033.1 50S ribosomal protein L25 [Bacteroidota bacterium]